jgi:tetratricopeptide (TPR) repeat protein
MSIGGYRLNTVIRHQRRFWELAISLACFLILGATPKLQAADTKMTPLPPVSPGKPCECKQSENQMLQTLKQQEKTQGPSSLMVSFTLDELAKIHLMQHRTADARKALLRALEIQRKQLAADDNHVAYTLGLIATTYHVDGELENYQKYSRQAMDIFQKNVQAGRPMQLEALDELAHLYVMDRSTEKAIPVYEQALKIAKERGASPMDLAGRYETLGMLYREPKTADKAIAYFKQAVDLRQKNRPKSNIGWAQLLWDKQMIGSLLILQEKYAPAADLFVNTAKALTDKQEKAFWQQSLLNYAQVFDRSNKAAEAKRLNAAAHKLK